MTKISYEQQQRMGVVRSEPRYIAPQPQQPAPVTALAVQPVQPLAPRALVDSHNRLLDIYAQQAARVGEVLPADSTPRSGYSSSGELRARNRRFIFTVGALVLVEAIAAWGIVSTANVGRLIGDVWTVPVWLSLTGIGAFVTIQRIHAGEQRLSPENIELVRANNEHAIAAIDAETRQLAIKLAARNDRERVRLERERNDLQREAGRRAAMETQARIADQMARHTQPQSSLNRLNNYRPTQQPSQMGGWDATDGPETAVACGAVGYDLDGVAPVDPVRQRLLNFVSDLYLDYSTDDQGRKTYRRIHADGRLRKGVIAPWAFRSDLTQEERRQLDELLRQITPRLFLYDEPTKTWALNLAGYRRVYMAVDAIGSAYTVS